jgi:hypothetical protein
MTLKVRNLDGSTLADWPLAASEILQPLLFELLLDRRAIVLGACLRDPVGQFLVVLDRAKRYWIEEIILVLVGLLYDVVCRVDDFLALCGIWLALQQLVACPLHRR